MRSWVFRNRRRLEALLGRAASGAVPARGPGRSLAPRVVELVPAPRPRHRER